MNGYGYYLGEAIQNHFMGKVTFVPPSNFYVALSTTSTDPAGIGINEPVGGAYARVSTTNANWNLALHYNPYTDAKVSNLDDISFPKSTAPWGTIHSFLVFDDATGGEVLWGGDLVADKTIETDTIAVFIGRPAPTGGDLSVSTSNTP